MDTQPVQTLTPLRWLAAIAAVAFVLLTGQNAQAQPSISIGPPSLTDTTGGPVTYTITYVGAQSVSLSAANVTLNTTGTATGSVAVTGGGRTSRTVRISGITGDGTIGISIAAGTAVDAGGNPAPAAGPSQTFNVDNTPPTISISAPSVSATNTGPVTYTVTYGGASNITLAAANITLNTTGSAAGTIGVSGTGTTTRTVTISGITGNGTLGISIAAGTATDVVGHTAPAAGPSGTFAVDNIAPTVTIGAPSLTSTTTGPVSYTISYTGATSVSLAAANVTLNRTGTANGTVSISGTGTTTRTVTISSITGDGTIGISLAAGTASDDAGNVAPAAGPSSTFSVDNTGPTVAIGAPSVTATRTGPVTYTLTYSDAAAVTLTAANITLNRTGTANGTVSVSGTGTITRTVTISSIIGDGTIGISVASGTATDTTGNPASGAGPSSTFLVDNTAPTVVISSPSSPATNTGPITYTISYTGADTISLAAANVTLNTTGTATGVIGVSGSGLATRTVTISSITGNGTIGISIAAATASDLAGNTAPAAGPSLSFSVDNTAPTISIGAPSVSVTNTGPVTFSITYTGADTVTLTAANVTLNRTGSANGTVSVSGSGTASRTVTVSGITGDGTIGISIAASTASDNAGNQAPAAGPSTTFNVDNSPPTISIGAPSATITNTGPVTYTITYGGATSVTLSAADVTLNTTGTATGTVSVSGSGTTTRTVAISGITGDGSLGISISAGTASDAIGSTAPAAGPSTTFNVDNTAPGVSIGPPSVSLTRTAPVTYTITYTGASAVTLAPTDITLNTTGTANGTIGVTGSGTATRTVTISGITGDGSLGITIAGGTATDTAGNGAVAAGPSTTFGVDNTPPGVTISAPSTTDTATGPVSYTITYTGANAVTLADVDVALNTTGSATGAISVSGSGTATRTVTISSITGSGTIGISIAANTASDAAGNSAGAAGPSTTFNVTSTAPPTTAISAPSVATTNSGPVTYTVTYGSASSVTLADTDITLNATGTASGTVAVSGAGVVSRTVTISGITGNGTLGISVGPDTASNAFGNAPAAGPSVTFTVDNTAPTASISLSGPSPTSANALAFTVLFSESVGTSFAESDVTATGSLSPGALVGVTGSGASYTVTVIPVDPDSNGTIGITIGSSITDLAGNPFAGASSPAQYVVDNTAPTATIALPDTNPTNADTVTFNVDFSESVGTSFTDADVTVTGSLAAGATVLIGGADPNYTVSVTPADPDEDGTVGITIGTAVSDLAGNAFSGGVSPDVYVVYNGALAVNISSPSESPTNDGPVTYTVTYGGATAITLSTTDITLNTTGTATGTVSVSGSGLVTRTVTISGISGDGTLSITIAAGTATDASANPASSVGPSDPIVVDNTAPGASITLDDPNPTALDSVRFGVTFDESVVTGFSAADVTVTGTLAAGASAAVTGVSPNFIVTVTPGDPNANGTIGIAIGADIFDLAGNAYAGGVSPDSYTLFNSGLSVTISAPSVSRTNDGPVTYTVTYADAASITLSESDITLNTTGTASGSVAVSGSGTTTRTVTISNIAGDGTLSITIAPGTAVDGGSVLASGAGPSSSFIVDNTAPNGVIALLDPNPTGLNSVRFSVDFNESVTGFNSGDVTVTGSLASGAGVAVTGASPSFVVTVTPSDPDADGTIGIGIGSGISDLAGNAYAGGTSPSQYIIDNFGLPEITLLSPVPIASHNGPVTFAIIYSNVDTVNLTLSHIVLNRTGTANGTLNLVGSGLIHIVTVNNITGEGTLSIRILAGSASLGGVNAAAAGPSTAAIIDRTRPVLQLVGPSHLTVEFGQPWVDPGATAMDNVDGDVSANIVVQGTVNTSAYGQYTLVYSVQDQAGNTVTVQRFVTVVDLPPVDAPVAWWPVALLLLAAGAFAASRSRGSGNERMCQ